MKIIDLGCELKNDGMIDPPHQRAVITYTDHRGGVKGMLATFPGLTEEGLPDGLAWAFERVQLSTHTGTHMDSPWHYHPTMNGGEPSFTIDKLPLEWCIAEGVKLDFSDREDGYRITAADVEEKLAQIGRPIRENDIVLLQSGAGPWQFTETFVRRGAGMSREATNYLTERGVHIVGTDGWSWDRPLSFEARDFRETGDTSLVWEGHFAGIDHGYFQMEKLANLDQLPAFGFRVICLPIKISGASAAWVRPVALLGD